MKIIDGVTPMPSDVCVHANHIYFWHDKTEDRPKTQYWQVRTNMNDWLGVIKWFGRWRQYCFFPESELVFDDGCLRDIASFCENLTREHKQKLSLHSKEKENQK